MMQDFGPANRDELFGYIVGGMNYTPATPTFEDMRDGILAAVAAGSPRRTAASSGRRSPNTAWASALRARCTAPKS